MSLLSFRVYVVARVSTVLQYSDKFLVVSIYSVKHVLHVIPGLKLNCCLTNGEWKLIVDPVVGWAMRSILTRLACVALDHQLNLHPSFFYL